MVGDFAGSKSVWWLLAPLALACVPQAGPTSVVNQQGEERALPARALRVVSHSEAARSGLVVRQIRVSFGAGKDGTELDSTLLERAEQQGAQLVSDISIVLRTSDETGVTECVTELVPETVSESHWKPGHLRSVPVHAPISRMVTERQYRCHMVSRPETRQVTEYQQRFISSRRSQLLFRAWLSAAPQCCVMSPLPECS